MDDTAGITGDMRCDTAFGLILGDCTAEIDRQLAVFLGSEAESGPHKARVALRRLTTALDVFAPILKRKTRAAARGRAKGIFRRLGRVRDADVLLAAEADAGGRRARETAALRARTRDRLRDSKAVVFAPALLRDLNEGRLLKAGRRGLAARAEPVSGLAQGALDAAWETGLSHGADVAALGDKARHEFRKDMKSLRYTAEFFEPLWPEARWAAFHAALQDLQDALGTLNDMAVARGRGLKRATADEIAALDQAAALWRRLVAAGPFWRDGQNDPD